MKKLVLALLTIAGLALVPGCRHDYCNTCETYESPEPACNRCDESCSIEPRYSDPACASGTCKAGSCPAKEYYDINMGETITIKEPKKAEPAKKAPSTKKATMKKQAPATPKAMSKEMAPEEEPMTHEMEQ